MNELYREVSPSEGSGSQTFDFDRYVSTPYTSVVTSSERNSVGIAGSARGAFPNAQDLLDGLNLHEDQHSKDSTIELGTVPYPDGIDPKNSSQEERQKLIDLLKKFNQV